MNIRILISVILLASCCHLRAESPSRVDFLGSMYLEIPFRTELARGEQRELLSLINAGDLTQALDRTAGLSSTLIASESETPLRTAKVTLNEALLLADARRFAEALVRFDAGIARIRDNYGHFHPDLASAYTARGLVNLHVDAKASIADLRRAQHVIHRHEGVFAIGQLQPLRALAAAHERTAQGFRSDIDYRFMVKVSEENHGTGSLSHVPILMEAARYFSRRGGKIPAVPQPWRAPVGQKDSVEHDIYRREAIFGESGQYYRRAMSIVEAEYGKNDIRVVPMLEGIAQLRVRQGSGLTIGEKALERAVSIITNSQSADQTDLAEAWVRLGDIYTVSSDRRATASYTKAWDLLSEDPELKSRRLELFNSPTRLETGLPPIPLVDRVPDSATLTEALFVEVYYNVRADGRVVNVRVTDSNLPYKWRNYVRTRTEATRYRPRMVNRELIDTEGLSYLHYFKARPSRGPRRPGQAEDADPDSADSDNSGTESVNTSAPTESSD